ncbi:MAG: hypothetical protein CFH19_00279 [Alphaproteobacteria bacterium MarineAlpha5_Bin9]|nr:MAG: hypothetical protein CFH19_00279 [Alphaproteobacteria bacterium MarineAlpha5_Bin9]|tara:strand:+ start:2719 stop:3609 length:891 start_codon:yes stop_codon:yes gene_type:complete
MKYLKFLFLLILFFTNSILADDSSSTKQSIISNITNSLAVGLQNVIGGEGDTEVAIATGEDYKPEISIMTVRPLTVHPGVDAWFVQLQFNETKIRGKGRFSINTGIGYRKLSENNNSFTGANLFIDYDEEGNARSSVGLELRSSAFEALANYYFPISNAQSVNGYKERTLGGYEVSIIGEIPYIPWANIVANHYEWSAEKNSKDLKGDKISIELTLTPNFVVEGGMNDNNIDGNNNFLKAFFVFPGRENQSASSKLIGEKAFSSDDMSLELLSKVRRSNKQVIESEGTGVVMARAE